jgi:hypothetical protein
LVSCFSPRSIDIGYGDPLARHRIKIVFVRHALDTVILQRVLIIAGVIAISGVAVAAHGVGTMNPLAIIAFVKGPPARLEFFSRDHPSWMIA